jgi:hypothetical protein
LGKGATFCCLGNSSHAVPRKAILNASFIWVSFSLNGMPPRQKH